MTDFWIGETRRIAHVVMPPDDTAFTVSSVSITIRSADGTAVITNGVGASEAGPEPNSITVYYVWTPATAGDYTYLLTYVVGGETTGVFEDNLAVYPTSSKFYPYVARVRRALADADLDEGQIQVSIRDVMDALQVAVNAVSSIWPQLLQHDQALDGATWEFALSSLTGWVDQVSEITAIEPRVDATQQARIYLPFGAWEVDLRRGKWRFPWYRGSSGDTARVDYTAQHVLSHTVDTLPVPTGGTADSGFLFDAVCLWAAGHLCGAPKANRAASTEAPEQGAGIVSRRDQTARLQSQADRLKKEAKALWARREYGL